MTAHAEGATPKARAACRNRSGAGLPRATSAMLNSLPSKCSSSPLARNVVASVTRDDVSDAALPYGSVASIDIESLRVIAARISYVGELGWELHVPFEQGAHLWDVLMEAGRPFGIVPVGLGAYGGTLRTEKSYRLMGNELELDRNLVEAGLARPRVKDAEFIGKGAYLELYSISCVLSTAAAVGPAFGGWARDTLGSFSGMFLLCSAITIIMLVATVFMNPPAMKDAKDIARLGEEVS